MIEPGVIRQGTSPGAGEFRRELFRPASGGAVDDAGFSVVGVELVDELAGGVRFRPHGQEEVRAIERAHKNLGRADKQPGRDFRPGRSVRRRGHSDRLDAMKGFRNLTQAQIFGAEVVAPLGDAVRLVDGEKINRDLAQGGDDVVAQQPLRRDVEKPERAVVEAARRPAALVGV